VSFTKVLSLGVEQIQRLKINWKYKSFLISPASPTVPTVISQFLPLNISIILFYSPNMVAQKQEQQTYKEKK